MQGISLFCNVARKGWMDCKKDGFKAGYITPFVNHVYYNLFKQIYKRFFIFYFFKKGKKRIKSLFGSQSLFCTTTAQTWY